MVVLGSAGHGTYRDLCLVRTFVMENIRCRGVCAALDCNVAVMCESAPQWYVANIECYLNQAQPPWLYAHMGVVPLLPSSSYAGLVCDPAIASLVPSAFWPSRANPFLAPEASACIQSRCSVPDV